MLKNVTLIAIAFFSFTAQAGILGHSFFAEPYLGFKTENSKLTNLLGTSTSIKSSAPYIGLKLGYRSMSGIDLNLFSELTKGKAHLDNLANPNDFSKMSSGIQLGINSLGEVKMYLGGSFQNDFKVEESSQIQEVTISGMSYHAGVQVKLVSWLNLGVQYYLNQYNKITGAAYTSGENLETYYSKIDTQEYGLYLSSTF
jgi:opacity protein-like surface antigen